MGTIINRALIISTLASICACSAPVMSQSEGAPKRALLIGINEYANSEVLKTLHGAVNDIELMKAVLVGKFQFPEGNIKMLRNKEATRKAIVDAIRKQLIEPTKQGDIVVFHYSGHGSQMTDTDGDEPDGYDETITTYDSRVGSVKDISDDELNALMQEIAAKTPFVTFILDSCHSGTAVRAAELNSIGVRAAPPDGPPATVRGEVRGGDGGSDFRALGAHYVLISGSRADELSNETSLGEANKPQGALTYFLAQTLKTSNSTKLTYRDLMDGVTSTISSAFPNQHPVLEGTGADTLVFGDKEMIARPYVLVEPVAENGEQKANVSAGSLFGFTEGSLLRVFPPDTKIFDDETQATATVRLSKVDPFSAKGTIQGAGTVAPHSRAVISEIHPAGFATGVYFHKAEDSPVLRAVKDKIAAYPSLEIKTTPIDADLRVRIHQDSIQIEGRESILLTAEGKQIPVVPLASLPQNSEKAAEAITKELTHWGKWYGLQRLSNPNPTVDARLEITAVAASSGAVEAALFEDGTNIKVAIQNLSKRELYVTIIDLATDGSTTVLYPAPGGEEKLPAGKRFTSDAIKMFVPEGRSVITDFVKAILTTSPIKAEVFNSPPSPANDIKRGGDEDPLQAYLTLIGQGVTRNANTPAVSPDWTTKTVRVRVCKDVSSKACRGELTTN